MRNIGRDYNAAGSDHKREGYIGPIASTGSNGLMTNINNLNNSQLRDLLTMMPYGISSRAKAGMKAQVIVNDLSNNTAVGVYDINRPPVDIGEIILYSIGGCNIYLDKFGKIRIKGDTTILGDLDVEGTFSINNVDIDSVFDAINDEINGILSDVDTLKGDNVPSNMLSNPYFGTTTSVVKTPWTFDTTAHTFVDSVNIMNGVNSMGFDSKDQVWGSDPCYGISSEKVSVTQNTTLTIRGYIMTTNLAKIDRGIWVQVQAYNSAGTYVTNIFDLQIPIASQGDWEQFVFSFNTSSYASVKVKFYMKRHGLAYISSPMLSVPYSAYNNVFMRATAYSDRYEIINFTGNVLNTIVSKGYVDNAVSGAQSGAISTSEAYTDGKISLVNADLVTKATYDYVNNLAMSVSQNSSNIIIPETYGAKGDGVTDDTAALQEAIDQASGYSTVTIDTSKLTTISGYLGSGGTEMASSDWTIYSPLSVQPNSEYTISNIDGSQLAYIVFYDASMTPTRSIIQDNAINVILTTADNEVYVRYSSKTTVPVVTGHSTAGRIVYLNRKTYIISDTIIIHKPVTIMGASSQDTVLFWKGTTIHETIPYDYQYFDECNAAFSFRADNVSIENFTLTNGATTRSGACAHNGMIFHYVKAPGITYYNGTGRLFMHGVKVNGFKSGLYLYAGWNRYIISCDFVNCGTAGIEYYPLELATVGNWSASGDIIQSSQCIGNTVGIKMNRAFETTVQNCVFEYNVRAIYSDSCLDCFFINCWNEANTDKIYVRGNAMFQGGYNVSQNTIEHDPNGEGTVTITKPSETLALRGTTTVFYQTRGVITKGVSIGSDYINMLSNPSFGTIALPSWDPWTRNAQTLTSLDKVNTINDVNSAVIDCTGQVWSVDPWYGITSGLTEVGNSIDYVFTCYVMSNDFAGINKGAHIEVQWYTPTGEYAGNYLYFSSNDVTPVANNVWEKVSVSFTSKSDGGYCKIKIALQQYGKLWISSPMLSLSTVTSDNISVKKTVDPNLFGATDYLGNTVAQLTSKDYVDTELDNRFIVNDTSTNQKYKWEVTVTNGSPTISLTEIT